jgi:hypothetical protein
VGLKWEKLPSLYFILVSLMKPLKRKQELSGKGDVLMAAKKAK